MNTSSRAVFRPLIAVGAVAALAGGSLLLMAAPAAAVSPGCTVVPSVAQTFAAGSTTSYVVPANVYTLDVVAQGGAGSSENNNKAPGGVGAQVTSALAVSPGETLTIDVATSAALSVGGASGGASSGGAGSVYDAPAFYSGGGGGASLVSDDATVLLVAGGGGGAGFTAPGGSAAPTPTAAVPAGTVSAGADGITTDPGVGGVGGTGGTATPGIGGADVFGYGAGPGFNGVGHVGGSSFTNSGESVGAGGGGGGYAGGGGGGGGGYAGGGGAGSSFSASVYAIAASTAVAPTVVVTPEASPAFTTAATTTLVAGATGSFSVCAASPVAVTLAETGALPSGVTFADNGDGTATIAGSATVHGTFAITITATNANGSTVQNFVLTVDPLVLATTGVDPTEGGILAMLLLALGGGLALGSRRRLRRSAGGASPELAG